LNTYGIGGGIPGKEHLKLLFSNEQEIQDLSQIMKETRDEIYDKIKYHGDSIDIQEDYCDVVVEGKETKMSKYLISSIRSFLLRSYYPDEQVTLVSIGGMNPKKLDFNPHWFIYGGLYVHLVAISLKIASIFNLLTISPDISYYFLHPEEMGKFFIVGRLVGALVGVLAVYIIYLLGSLLYNKNVGLIAALFLAIMPAVVVFSHYLKPYIFDLPFLLLAFYYAVKILDSDKFSNYIFAGIFAGIAGGVLIVFGYVFLAILIAHLIKRISQHRKIITIFSIFEKRIFLSVIAFIGAYLAVNPYILVSMNEAINEFKFLSRCSHFSLTLEHCFYYFRVSLATGLGWPLLIVITAGLAYSLYKRERKDILLLSFIFPGYLYISATKYNFIHYGIWLLPFLILLGARVIGTGLEKGRLIRCVALIILLAISAYTFTYSLACDRLFAEEDIRTTCGKWMVANIEKGASIGYIYQPTPFAAPLVNPFKYKIRWWEKDRWWGEKDLDTGLPQYFVWAENIHSLPEGLDIKSQYQEMKRFDKPPSIFGIKFKNEHEKDYPWSILNPNIVIYKLKERP